MSTSDSWWNDDQEDIQGISKHMTDINKVIVDTKNVTSCETPNTNNNVILPSLNKKTNEVEEDGIPVIQDMRAAPPLMCRTIVNDEFIISSNITMETRMDMVERNIVTTNTTICNLYNSVNYMNHKLNKFMKGFRQGINLAPAEFPAKFNDQKLTIQENSTTVNEVPNLSD